MALTPRNEEAFLREVDEEVRKQQIGDFWRRYGILLVVVVVISLASFGAYLWWQHDQHAKAGVAGEEFTKALADITQNRETAAKPVLDKLAASSNEGYAANARLTLAAVALTKNDPKAAIAQYKAIVADQSLAQPHRDLALIRQTAVEFDVLPPQQVIDRLKPLAVEGGPWFGSAGEMVALAYAKMGKRDLAGPLFAALAKDANVPQTLRDRARRLAGVYGVDAVPDPEGPAKE